MITTPLGPALPFSLFSGRLEASTPAGVDSGAGTAPPPPPSSTSTRGRCLCLQSVWRRFCERGSGSRSWSQVTPTRSGRSRRSTGSRTNRARTSFRSTRLSGEDGASTRTCSSPRGTGRDRWGKGLQQILGIRLQKQPGSREYGAVGWLQGTSIFPSVAQVGMRAERREGAGGGGRGRGWVSSRF